MKKIKLKQQFLWRLVLITIGLLSLIFLVYKVFKPYYKVEDRTSNIKKFTGANGEKALGWIRVQGTNIDFPIVYYDESDTSDPTYELGWSFSNKTNLQKKTTVFSHNILNVSSNPLIGDENHKRFEQLMAYIYTDFVKENKYIQYTTRNGKNYLFKIYGVSFQKEKNLDYENINPSKKELKEYIQSRKKASYFNFNTDVDENDKLISLVTCTRFFGQTTEYSFVVDARLVRKNEMIKNYKVTERKTYERIKKIMKGDVDNDA